MCAARDNNGKQTSIDKINSHQYIHIIQLCSTCYINYNVQVFYNGKSIYPVVYVWQQENEEYKGIWKALFNWDRDEVQDLGSFGGRKGTWLYMCIFSLIMYMYHIIKLGACYLQMWDIAALLLYSRHNICATYNCLCLFISWKRIMSTSANAIATNGFGWIWNKMSSSSFKLIALCNML